MTESPAYPGAPRWAKIAAAIAVALVLALVLAHLTGVNFGRHGLLQEGTPAAVTAPGAQP